MGNSICPIDDVSQLASVARDICPFPNYSIAPLFINMLSVNASVHLRDHYTVVQSSLTPKQLEDLTQSLRSTFGREGKVTLGGMGVVALSLAVLFDTFAKQVRGEWVLDSGPIPGLFVKNPRGYYPPQVHTASELLRLVPHIANNPSRMRKETERCLKRLKFEDRSLEKVNQNDMLPKKDASSKLNYFMMKVLAYQLMDHYHLINVIVKMGNLQCPAEDAAALASVARDICPFPYYDPNPLFLNMMSLNSSVHLRDHYKKVQSSLEPKQLEDFTQSLSFTVMHQDKVISKSVEFCFTHVNLIV